MDYDVLILGGGIIGCAVAYELSKYSLNIALIEKDYDIADDIALFNSSIVYNGIEADNLFMSELEFNGNKLFDDLCDKIQVPFKRCDSLMLSYNEKDNIKIVETYNKALKRGIKNIRLLNSKEIAELEPNLSFRAKQALYSNNTGIVCPYDLAIAYGEIAFDNGVKFKLEEEVIDIEKISKAFRVTTNKNKFTCKMVINTTPGQNYSIDISEKVERKESYQNYFVIDKDCNIKFNNALFVLNREGEKVSIVNSVQGNTIIVLDTEKYLIYHEGFNKIKDLLPDITRNEIGDFYQEQCYKDNIIIDDTLFDNGYIKVIADHYAQVTITPAIGKMLCNTVVKNLGCILKKDFIGKRREIYRFSTLDNKARNKLIKMDKGYGNIVCRCKNITEGEIVDAIRRPLGARTLEGINRRTGVTFGKCKGSECIGKVVDILAREMNKKPTEIVKDSKNSYILSGRIKEF